DALLLLRLVIGIAELALEEPVNAPHLLLLAQLDAVPGQPRILLAVLSRRVVAALDGALVGEAFLALQEELLAFPAALPAFRVEISGHVGLSCLSDPAPLRRAAAVVRHRRHVGYRRDLEAHGVQRAHRGLASRAGTLDAHLEVLDPRFLGDPA